MAPIRLGLFLQGGNCIRIRLTGLLRLPEVQTGELWGCIRRVAVCKAVTLLALINRPNQRSASLCVPTRHWSSIRHRNHARPLSIDTNRTIIQKLWNRYLTAYEGGKDDPGLSLLRFNASRTGGRRAAAALGRVTAFARRAAAPRNDCDRFAFSMDRNCEAPFPCFHFSKFRR